MINGAHIVIYSTDPDADRSFFKDVLGLPNVDVGQGWLIFGLPPAEIAVHPADQNNKHELYLMCESIGSCIDQLREKGIECGPIQDQGWGILTTVILPGGGKVGVYEPRHAKPNQAEV